MHSQQEELVPSQVTPYLPHHNITFLIHHQVVVGDIQHNIQMERHGLGMEERLITKLQILHGVQHIIDWIAFWFT